MKRHGFINVFMFLLLALAAIGCTSNEQAADGDQSDGDAVDGDATDGDSLDGDLADGDLIDGDKPDGDGTDGDTVDGDAVDGDATDGDASEGDQETDYCASAIPLSCEDHLAHSTITQGRANEWGGYSCTARAMSGRETVYTFTSPYGQTVNISLSDLSTDLDILLLSNCDAFACTQAASTPLDIQDGENLSFYAAADTPYVIVVDGYDGAEGDYTLDVFCVNGADGDEADGDEIDGDIVDGDVIDGDIVDGDVVDGDIVDGDEEIVCPTLQPLVCGDRKNHNNLIQGRSNQWQNYSCGGDAQTSYEALYELTLTDDCEVTVSLGNLSNNLNLYRLSDCAESACVAASANAGTATDSMSFSGLADDRFIFAVDAPSSITSNYRLSVDCICGGTDGDVEEEAEVDEEGLFELGPIDGLTVNFNFNTNNFFASPWPSNAHIGVDGKINLPGFPRPPFDLSDPIPYLLVGKYVSLAESTMTGFGPNTSIYFTFSAPIDTTTLPGSAASMNWSSSILLVDIDPDSPDYGELVPMQWHWSPTQSQYEPGNLLALSPYDGFPLHPDTTYAAILTGAVTDKQGGALGRTQQMADLYSGRPSGDARLDAVYQPLAAFLAANADTFDPERVRAATVFTIEDPVAETRHMRDYVRTEYPNGELSGALISCEPYNVDANHACFQGQYTSPNFQVTENYYDPNLGQSVVDYPHAIEGGQFAFDSNGDPIEQVTETLDFLLCVPQGAPPANGWPTVIYSHGTGGDFGSLYTEGPYNEMEQLTAKGMAVIGIAQPLHGSRGLGYSQSDLELYSFNFGNPDSARSTLRQSVMDNVALIDFIQSGLLDVSATTCDSWPGNEAYAYTNAQVDPEHLLFMGHSQGGLTGALLAGIEPGIDAYMLSGTGGRIGITVMERQDPDVLGMLVAYGIIASKSEAYKLHPLLSLVQLLTEITDPVNYARHYIMEPFDNHARSVLMTTGFLDAQTPKNASYALATAGLLQLTGNGSVPETVPGLVLRGYDWENWPVSGNLLGPDSGAVTSGLVQFPTGDHFVIFQSGIAADLYTHFLESAAYESLPIIDIYPGRAY